MCRSGSEAVHVPGCASGEGGGEDCGREARQLGSTTQTSSTQQECATWLADIAARQHNIKKQAVHARKRGLSGRHCTERFSRQSQQLLLHLGSSVSVHTQSATPCKLCVE